MYDEINTVNSTINNIKKNNSPIIVIQSDPNQSEKLVEQDQVDFIKNYLILRARKRIIWRKELQKFSQQDHEHLPETIV